MKQYSEDEEERLRQLASTLDCLLEQDVQLLADVDQSTTAAWRKRHTGPSYLRFGRTFLYPREGLAEFLRSRVRERLAVDAKALL